MVTTSLMVYWH